MYIYKCTCMYHTSIICFSATCTCACTCTCIYYEWELEGVHYVLYMYMYSKSCSGQFSFFEISCLPWVPPFILHCFDLCTCIYTVCGWVANSLYCSCASWHWIILSIALSWNFSPSVSVFLLFLQVYGSASGSQIKLTVCIEDHKFSPRNFWCVNIFLKHICVYCTIPIYMYMCIAH